jgi:hypothetical protein
LSHSARTCGIDTTQFVQGPFFGKNSQMIPIDTMIATSTTIRYSIKRLAQPMPPSTLTQDRYRDFGGKAPGGATSNVLGSESSFAGSAGTGAGAATEGCAGELGQRIFGFSTNRLIATTMPSATAAPINSTVHVRLSERLKPSFTETGVVNSL